jgi:hypothetical protein
VSQPYKRGATVPAPGKVDKKLGEFWVDNPWDIAGAGFNLSSFERTRLFLNIKGKNFLDVSYLAGADTDGDGRCVVAGDFRNNGRLEVVLRQVGGGPLLLYENNFPQRHYLEVSLRGRRSNRLGIGARIEAHVRGQRLVRELFPANSFRSQMPTVVHLGLGEAKRVDELTIRWPSGEVQELKDMQSDRHIIVNEGKKGAAAVETVMPGKTIPP